MSRMRLRSQPLSPSGFVSLDTAPKPRTSLRKKATKKNANDAASNDAATEEVEQPVVEEPASNEPTNARGSGRTTRKRNTRASSAVAEDSSAPAKAAAAAAPKTRKTRGASAAVEEDAGASASKAPAATPATKRGGKRKTPAEDALKIDEEAPRPTQKQRMGNAPTGVPANPPSPPSTFTETVTVTTTNAAKTRPATHPSPPPSQPSQEQEQEPVPSQSPAPEIPGSFSPKRSQQQHTTAPPNTTSSTHQEPTPPIPSFTSNTTSTEAPPPPPPPPPPSFPSFDSDAAEPRFFSQPDPISRSPPLLSQSTSTHLPISHSQSFSASASVTSMSARPTTIRRIKTPYAERSKRRQAGNEGRVGEKTVLRVAELVDQNERDLERKQLEQQQLEQGHGGVSGVGRKRKFRDIYTIEQEKRAKRRLEEMSEEKHEEEEEVIAAKENGVAQQQSNGVAEGQNGDKAGPAALRTPSPLRTPTPTSSQDKSRWLPNLLSSVPRSLTRIVGSPFHRKRAGRTPRTESRVQSLKGPQYSFSPSFLKLASKLNFGVSSSQESSSEQGSQESQVDEHKKVDEETTAVEEVPKSKPESQREEPAASQSQQKPQKTKKLIKKQEEKYDDLEYSLLPQPLDISPMFEDEHDAIIPSIERSDSPPAQQSCPTSDDLEETIYRDGIPLWDSEKTHGEKRKRREKEHEVSEDQTGAKWEAYSSREATEEYDVDLEAAAASNQLLQPQQYPDAPYPPLSLSLSVPGPDNLHTIPEEEDELIPAPDPQDLDVDDHRSPAMKRIKRVRFDSSPQDTPSKLRARRFAQSSTYAFDDSLSSSTSSNDSTGSSSAAAAAAVALPVADKGTPIRKHFAGMRHEHLAQPRKYSTGGAALDFSPFSRSFVGHVPGHEAGDGKSDDKGEDTEEDEIMVDDIEYAPGPSQVYHVRQPSRGFSFDSDEEDSGDESPKKKDEAVSGKTASLFSQSFSSSVAKASFKSSSSDESAKESESGKQSLFSATAPATPKKDLFAMPPPATPSLFASPSAPAPPNFTANAGMTPGRHDPAYLEKISKMRENAEKYKPKKSSGLRMSSETPEGEEKEKEEVSTTAVSFAPAPAPASAAVESFSAVSKAPAAAAEAPPRNYAEFLHEYEALDWPAPSSFEDLGDGDEEMFEDDDDDMTPATAASSPPSTSPMMTSQGKEKLTTTELVNKYWTPEDSHAALKLFDKEYERFKVQRAKWNAEGVDPDEEPFQIE